MTVQTEDDAVPGLDIFAKFDLTLTNLNKQLQVQNRRYQRELESQPVYQPLPGTTVLNANGNGLVDLGSPMDGRSWTIRQLLVAEQNQEQNLVEGNTAAATAAFAAGATATVNPPFYSRYITGFDVTFSAATAAGSTTVTLSNVAGGPYVWTIQQETTAGTSLSIRFPGKGLLPFGNPALTVSATVGGGSGDLTLYSTQTGSPAVTCWYVGAILPVMGSVTSQLRWKQPVMPALDTFTTNLIQVKAREHLFAVVTTGLANEIITVNAMILDHPAKPLTPVVQE